MRTGTASSSTAAPLRSQPQPKHWRARAKPNSGEAGKAFSSWVPFVPPLRRPARPRTPGSKFTTVSTTQPPAPFAKESAILEAEYGADYAGSRSIFITDDSSLQDLSFSIGAADPTKPVRARCMETINSLRST